MNQFMMKIYYTLEKVFENKYKNMSTEQKIKALKIWYKLIVKEDLNLETPRNFNEKMQSMKIYDSTELKTRLSDKYLVREWVEQTIGKKYLIPLLGCWETPESIDFSELPEQYVLKANHGSGMNYIVKSNSLENHARLKKMANRWMHTPSGVFSLEQHYYGIKRKILAEEYIEQKDGGLFDYKIHCFKGVPKFIQVIGDRSISNHQAKEAYFDTEWNQIEGMHNIFGKLETLPDKPTNLSELLSVSEILSANFEYVRVDLYDVDGCIYFGEMTFTPAEGLGRWARYLPDEWWK